MATIRERGTKWQTQVRRLGTAPITRSFLQRADVVAWARQIEADADRRGLAQSTNLTATSLNERLWATGLVTGQLMTIQAVSHRTTSGPILRPDRRASPPLVGGLALGMGPLRCRLRICGYRPRGITPQVAVRLDLP
jgi:hypothetical protein